jgi:predicted O-methyltransferase YrrM
MVPTTNRGGARAIRRTAASLLTRFTARFANPALQEELRRLEAGKSEAPLRQLLQLQDRIGEVPTAWRDLGAVAYELVRTRQPRMIVELGSFAGFSACALALALKDHVPGGRLYAVDTWQGDPNTGAYGEQVYQQFLTFRRELGLEDIILPLRMSFAEARSRIPGPIDLLHIDGWHTFRAVRRDFRMYQQQLAPNSRVIFHDVNTFFLGMRLFWLLTSWQHPTALVPYSHGLGVLRWRA